MGASYQPFGSLKDPIHRHATQTLRRIAVCPFCLKTGRTVSHPSQDFDCLPQGAPSLGIEGPKMATVGTPIIAARWARPESLPIKHLVVFIKATTSERSSITWIGHFPSTCSLTRGRRSDSAGPRRKTTFAPFLPLMTQAAVMKLSRAHRFLGLPAPGWIRTRSFSRRPLLSSMPGCPEDDTRAPMSDFPSSVFASHLRQSPLFLSKPLISNCLVIWPATWTSSPAGGRGVIPYVRPL